MAFLFAVLTGLMISWEAGSLEMRVTHTTYAFTEGSWVEVQSIPEEVRFIQRYQLLGTLLEVGVLYDTVLGGGFPAVRVAKGLVS